MADRNPREQLPPEEPLTPDMIEQRQRPDGSVEDLDPFERGADQPLSPDMIEQRQGPDGALVERGDPDLGEGPLTPDMIEQRQVIDDDDGDEDRRGE